MARREARKKVRAGGKSDLRDSRGNKQARRTARGSEGKKGCVRSEGERGGPSYNAPLVHYPEEMRGRGRTEHTGMVCRRDGGTDVLARSSLFRLSFSYTSLPRSIPPVPSPSCCTLRGDKERDAEKERERRKRNGKKESEGWRG